jgi:hypothetical protein
MVEGVNSNMIYLMCCKNFCKSHNVPPPSTTIKNNNNNKRFRIGLGVPSSLTTFALLKLHCKDKVLSSSKEKGETLGK